MHDDVERCYRAVQSKDARFDGWFVTAVLTTGIYCRPSCPARTPHRRNVRFFPTAAAAQQAGFRACKRCRPDAAPGSPEWNTRADVVARAMRLIADGLVDREGVPGLAARLGYSTRQIERLLRAEVGAGPLALARSQRAQTARVLIETTSMTFAEVAFAAGFSSIRQFNDTVREVFASSPTELRTRRQRASRDDARTDDPASSWLTLRLPVRLPFDPDTVLSHLAARTVSGCEEVRGGCYRRTMRLPGGHCIVELRPAPDHVVSRLTITDVRDLPAAIARCRRLLDLDADPEAITEQLARDRRLGPYVRKVPGRRVVRTVDEHETALRAVLGQQVSTKAARAAAAKLVARYGTPVDDPIGGLTHLFPTAAVLAEVDPDDFGGPSTRRRCLSTLARALADGDVELHPGADWERTRSRLLALPGVGPWTTEIIAMRALGDPDALAASDLGLRNAAGALGLPTDEHGIRQHAERWRPWRSYAVQHLWATLDHPTDTPPIGTAKERT